MIIDPITLTAGRAEVEAMQQGLHMLQKYYEGRVLRAAAGIAKHGHGTPMQQRAHAHATARLHYVERALDRIEDGLLAHALLAGG